MGYHEDVGFHRAPHPAGSQRILVAEDDEQTRELAVGAFVEDGHDVFELRGGDELAECLLVAGPGMLAPAAGGAAPLHVALLHPAGLTSPYWWVGAPLVVAGLAGLLRKGGSWLLASCGLLAPTSSSSSRSLMKQSSPTVIRFAVLGG